MKLLDKSFHVHHCLIKETPCDHSPFVGVHSAFVEFHVPLGLAGFAWSMVTFSFTVDSTSEFSFEGAT